MGGEADVGVKVVKGAAAPSAGMVAARMMLRARLPGTLCQHLVSDVLSKGIF